MYRTARDARGNAGKRMPVHVRALHFNLMRNISRRNETRKRNRACLSIVTYVQSLKLIALLRDIIIIAQLLRLLRKKATRATGLRNHASEIAVSEAGSFRNEGGEYNYLQVLCGPLVM